MEQENEEEAASEVLDASIPITVPSSSTSAEDAVVKDEKDTAVLEDGGVAGNNARGDEGVLEGVAIGEVDEGNASDSDDDVRHFTFWYHRESSHRSTNILSTHLPPLTISSSHFPGWRLCHQCRSCQQCPSSQHPSSRIQCVHSTCGPYGRRCCSHTRL